MKPLLLYIFVLWSMAMPVFGATPAFQSFDTNDFTITPSLAAPQKIHSKRTGVTNVFNNSVIINTNTFVTNITTTIINTNVTEVIDNSRLTITNSYITITNTTINVSNSTITNVGSIFITNLFAVTLTIADWGLVITNANPSAAPVYSTTLLINVTDNSSWVWYGSSWVQINPSLATGLYVVPTVVELRQIDACTRAPQHARTYGNLVSFDSQGSEYGWDPDSLDDDNGMSIVKPDCINALDPGRWRQLTSS